MTAAPPAVPAGSVPGAKSGNGSETSPEEVRRQAFDRLREFSAERGLKKSRQREVILDRFLKMGGHVSADDVHAAVRDEDPTVGRTTVYRALSLFCDARIASSIELRDGRTRFEPLLSREHHDHLICIECGRIEEFLSPEVEARQEEIAEARGFRLISHRHQLYGACPRCRTGAGA